MPEPAVLALLRQGLIPHRILAIGIPAAGEEGLPPFGLALGQLAVAARLGARHPGGDGLDGLALGIVGAG